jgi:hypothetical protein
LLDSEDATLASNGVFGSMWLQNFVAYFEYDFSGVNNTDQMTLFISEDFALNGTTITKTVPSNDGSAFSYVAAPVVIPVTVSNTTMTASIYAQLGYQGLTEFLVSMTANLI